MIKTTLTHYLYDIALDTFFDNVSKNLSFYNSSIVLDDHTKHLISKWSPIINSNVGGIVPNEHVGLLAICCEEQARYNRENHSNGNLAIQQYALPLIRKLFGSANKWKISGEYTPTFMAVKTPFIETLITTTDSYACMILEQFYIDCERVLSMTTMNGMLISTTKTHIELYI